eukprot:TRINITY_DN25793_c0_g1_i1.p1 TRINITY_DN25793_c0_g1~~TRINITY_DN25793_c0_g1_i1.p1  ORF type:complete len:1659 (+),score=354.93 TRINITY_DN25793_c0_g1_i1:37-4977(+)
MSMHGSSPVAPLTTGSVVPTSAKKAPATDAVVPVDSDEREARKPSFGPSVFKLAVGRENEDDHFARKSQYEYRKSRPMSADADSQAAGWQNGGGFPSGFAVDTAPRLLGQIEKNGAVDSFRSVAYSVALGLLAGGCVDGSIVLLGHDTTVLETDNKNAVSALGFGNGWLAAGKTDGSVRLLMSVSESVFTRHWECLEAHAGTIHALAVSRRGRLATVGEDGYVNVFTPCRFTLDGGRSETVALTTSAISDVTARMGSRQLDEIKDFKALDAAHWRGPPAKVPIRLPKEEEGREAKMHADGPLLAVSFSSCGLLAVGGNLGLIRVYRPTLKLLWKKEYAHRYNTTGKHVQALAFSPNKLLASGGTDGSIVLFSELGEELHRLEKVHAVRGGHLPPSVLSLAFIMTGVNQCAEEEPEDEEEEEGSLRGVLRRAGQYIERKLLARKKIWKQRLHLNSTNSHEHKKESTYDNVVLVSGAEDGSLVAFNDAFQEVRRTSGSGKSRHHAIRNIASAEKGRFVLQSHCSLSAYSFVGENLWKGGDKQGCYRVAVSQSGRIAMNDGKHITIFDDIGNEETSFLASADVHSIAFTGHGGLVCMKAEGQTRYITVYDAAFEELWTTKLDSKQHKALVAGITPSDGRIAFASGDKIMVYGQMHATGPPLRTAPECRVFVQRSSRVLSLAFMADGKLASGWEDGHILVHTSGGKELGSLAWRHHKPVEVIAAFSGKQGLVASASEDGVILVHGLHGDHASGEKICRIKRPHGQLRVHALALIEKNKLAHTDKHRLASGGTDKTVKLWSLPDSEKHGQHVLIGCYPFTGRVSCLAFPMGKPASSMKRSSQLEPESTGSTLSLVQPGERRQTVTQLAHDFVYSDIRQDDVLIVGLHKGQVNKICLHDFPLGACWETVTSYVENQTSSRNRELFEVHPRLLAQPLPIFEYSLLHHFVARGHLRGVKAVCDDCVRHGVWGGLNQVHDGKNLLDLAMQVDDIAIIRVVLNYLCKVPVYATDSPDWSVSAFRCFLRYPSQLYALPKFLDSRLAEPGLLAVDQEANLSLPSNAAPCGTKLRVIGCNQPSMRVSKFQEYLAKKGNVPIVLQTLRLPGFEEEWVSHQLLEVVGKASDALLESTAFHALVAKAWREYGRREHTIHGARLFLDLCIFIGFSYVTAIEASGKNMKPQLHGSLNDLVRWVGGFCTLIVTAHCLIFRYLLPWFQGSRGISKLLVMTLLVLRMIFAILVTAGEISPLWIAPMSMLDTVRMEVHALTIQGLEVYLSDSWNHIDIITAVATLVVEISVLYGAIAPKSAVLYLSPTAFIMWFKMLYFLRAYAAFGNMIRMILETVQTMMYFFFIMLIMILGLTHAWSLLGIANNDSHFLQEEDTIICEPLGDGTMGCGSGPQGFQNAGWAVLASFFVMYRLVLVGDFEGDAFALADFSGIPGDEPGLETAFISWIFFFVATLLFLVLLLNLLIAVISDKYDELKSKSEVTFWRERAIICLEARMNMIVPRDTHKYLIVSFPKPMTETETDEPNSPAEKTARTRGPEAPESESSGDEVAEKIGDLETAELESHQDITRRLDEMQKQMSEMSKHMGQLVSGVERRRARKQTQLSQRALADAPPSLAGDSRESTLLPRQQSALDHPERVSILEGEHLGG